VQICSSLFLTDSINAPGISHVLSQAQTREPSSITTELGLKLLGRVVAGLSRPSYLRLAPVNFRAPANTEFQRGNEIES
jgi:hypothetical protein